MIPVLGQKYEIDIEVMSKPKADYMTDEYFELDLPVAPAVMVGNENRRRGIGCGPKCHRGCHLPPTGTAAAENRRQKLFQQIA